MLLQNTIDTLASNKIIDFASNKFWEHPNFWIEITLAVIGIFIGWKAYKEANHAFREAGKAKDAATEARDAANKAGKTVKKHSILLTISEITRVIGQIRQNTNYEDANNRLMEINGKVRNIIGFYRDDVSQSQQNLMQQIETCASNVLIEFNLLDPESEARIIYNKIRPNITLLSGHLNELQGAIENELIINN